MSESETKIQYVEKSPGELVIKFYSGLSLPELIKVYGDTPLSFFLEKSEEIEN